MSTTRVTIEITTAEPGASAAVLLATMLRDQRGDPKHRLTLETRDWAVDVKVIDPPVKP